MKPSKQQISKVFSKIAGFPELVKGESDYVGFFTFEPSDESGDFKAVLTDVVKNSKNYKETFKFWGLGIDGSPDMDELIIMVKESNDSLNHIQMFESYKSSDNLFESLSSKKKNEIGTLIDDWIAMDIYNVGDEEYDITEFVKKEIEEIHNNFYTVLKSKVSPSELQEFLGALEILLTEDF